MEKSIDGVKGLKRQNLAAARIPYGEACRPLPCALRPCFALPPLQVGLCNRNQPHGEGYPHPGP